MEQNLKGLVRELNEKLVQLTIPEDLTEDNIDEELALKNISLNSLKEHLNETLNIVNRIVGSAGQQDISFINEKILGIKIFGLCLGFFFWLLLAPFISPSFSEIKANIFTVSSDSTYAHPMAKINYLSPEENTKKNTYIENSKKIDLFASNRIASTLLFFYGMIFLMYAFCDSLEWIYRKSNRLQILSFQAQIRDRLPTLMFLFLVFLFIQFAV